MLKRLSKIKAVRYLILSVFLLSFAGNPVPLVPEQSFRPEFRDIEIRDFLKTMAQITQKNILIDDSVKGKITIISHHSIPVSKAYEFMKQVLEVRGFGVIEEPHLIKIVIRTLAEDSSMPVQDSVEESGSGIFPHGIVCPCPNQVSFSTTYLASI